MTCYENKRDWQNLKKISQKYKNPQNFELFGDFLEYN